MLSWRNRIVFVWNTKTRQSARYYYDNDAWHRSTAALPDPSPRKITWERQQTPCFKAFVVFFEGCSMDWSIL